GRCPGRRAAGQADQAARYGRSARAERAARRPDLHRPCGGARASLAPGARAVRAARRPRGKTGRGQEGVLRLIARRSARVSEASVPGFTPEQVEVTFEDGTLTIKGQRSSESEEKKGEYVRRERRHASVYRRVGLPAEVRADEISASFDNGVLRITVPRAQKAQPKRIPVTAGSNGSPQVIEHQKS